MSMTQWAQQWITVAGGGKVTKSSVKTIETALSSSVVWRCATKNAATLASFPVHAHSGRAKMDPAPQLVADPEGDAMTLPSTWVFGNFMSMYLRGGANWWITTEPGTMRPKRAAAVHPDRVDWSTKDGWLLDGKPVDHWPVGQLMHVPMYTLPGSPKGLNPLQFAAKSLFPGMTAQEFGGNFFADGAHPTAIIAPDHDPGPDGAKALKARVMEATEGTNREPLVLPQSIKWTPLQINPDDSQFIELMKLSDEQVCRYMGTPPLEIGIAPSGSNTTYANREQNKQDYLQELLWPMRQLQTAWSSLLPDPVTVKLNPAGLLQADLKGRYESYKIAAEINKLTGEIFLDVDEMRELEEREPVADETGTKNEGRSLSAAEVAQKVYLAVGNTITSDEGRQMINDAGGNLPIPGPIFGEPKEGDDA